MDGSRKTFESLGCIVEQAEPDFAPAEIAFRVLRAWNSANAYGAQLQEHPELSKTLSRVRSSKGFAFPAWISRAPKPLTAKCGGAFRHFWKSMSTSFCPLRNYRPFDVNIPYPAEVAGVKVGNYIDWMKSCWYISVTGNPAASVPGGFTAEGLPVGVQIVGRDRADFAVLQLAHAFEEAAGFSKKRPVIA